MFKDRSDLRCVSNVVDQAKKSPHVVVNSIVKIYPFNNGYWLYGEDNIRTDMRKSRALLPIPGHTS